MIASNLLEMYDDIKLYSGRGMYGRECIATSSYEVVDELKRNYKNFDGEPCKDNMGLSFIYYFKSVSPTTELIERE